MSVLPESHYIGAYWGPRNESAERCGSRLAEHLQAMGRLDPLFSQWYLTGRSRKGALSTPIEPAPEELGRLLGARVQRRDDPARTAMPELGFSVSIWNGQRDGVQVSVRCGVTAAISGAVSNSVVVQLPPGVGETARLYGRDLAQALFTGVVSAWDPSWSTFTNHRLRRAQASDPWDVVGGWATFVATARRPPADELPQGLSCERLAAGLVLTVSGEPDQAAQSLVTAAGRMASQLARGK